jgi:trimethylamine--corrinoid protein Co-methyltransferase
MRIAIQVLNNDELTQVHERSLRILVHIGARVESAKARKILSDAGAHVEEKRRIVRFPQTLVEEALRLAPRDFTLGGRRPGWYWPMNHGDCTLLADGEAKWVVNAATGQRQLGTKDDWLKATQLIDVLDEIGLYWRMVGSPSQQESTREKVAYWRNVFTHFTKHVQDSTETIEQSYWLLEVLQTIFGGREAVRLLKPFSFLLCPVSPLVIEGSYTDAYLQTAGWDIPVAIMPMPIMGMSSPARLIATTVVGNCDVLAMLCLIQASSPGTPVIYAPALATADPRTGRYTGGAVEHSLLSIATTQMARFYNLPVEASTGGTNEYVPGIQAGYERAINWTLPTLAWPDILVGPGLFEGSTVLCYEQLLLDVEVFRHCRRLHLGIGTEKDQWLEEVIARLGPGGNFLKHQTTRDALRSGEWYLSTLGEPEVIQKKLGLLEEVRDRIDEILAQRKPLPLDDDVNQELEQIERRAIDVSS